MHINQNTKGEYMTKTEIPFAPKRKEDKSKNKNKKMLKRIDKFLTRIEKQVVKLQQVSQRLTRLRGEYAAEQKAA
jgi:hypothetical protein